MASKTHGLWWHFVAWVLSAGLLSACGGGGGGGGDGGTATEPEPEPEPEPLTWYLVLAPTTAMDGETITPLDVISYRPDTDAASILEPIGATPAAVDAYERVSETQYYFSLDRHADLNGTIAAPGDIVLHDSGTYSLALDASAAGIGDGVDVDALSVADNGDLVFSTDVHFNVAGTSFGDADLVRYDGNGFALYLSASALGLDAAADVDAFTLRGSDALALSTRTAGTTNALIFDHADVLLATHANGVESVALDTVTTLAASAGVAALSDNQ